MKFSYLGIVASAREKSSVRGGFGKHEERLKLCNDAKLALNADGKEYQWTAPLWVSASPDSPAILGHSGFLEYFIATFDGDKRELELKPTKKFPGKATDLWD